MSDENRADTMAVKLGAYAQRAGARSDAIVAGYRKSVALRLNVLGDVFHPDLLHPARTALILIDAECSDETVLTAATLCETEFPEMRIGEAEIRDEFGDSVAALVGAVPRPRDFEETLLEELILARREIGLLAVAERLDHARHLHFRHPRLWPAFHEEIVEIYLPFAWRVSEALQHRLKRWSEAFEKRLAIPE